MIAIKAGDVLLRKTSPHEVRVVAANANTVTYAVYNMNTKTLDPLQTVDRKSIQSWEERGWYVKARPRALPEWF